MTRVSVCVAAYNGLRFIEEQLRSILAELSSDDEVIVVDDKSSDETLAFLKGIKDDRIHIYENEKNIGVNKTFERAMSLASGKFVFLSDQDDVWVPGRIEKMIHALKKPQSGLVVSNYSVIDRDGNVIGDGLAERLVTSDDQRRIANLLGILLGKKNYYGCAMGMTKKFCNAVTPFPEPIECHDLWIAIVANVSGRITHLDDDTLMHRIHGNNASDIKRPLFTKIFARVELLGLIIRAFARRNRVQ